MKKGFSLIEILVVISVFAIIGLVTSQTILTTFRGARRTDSDTLVRQNLDYALSVVDRQLRNAQSITSCSGNRIDFRDADGSDAYFTLSSSAIVFSNNSSKITSSDVSVTSLNFTCIPGSGNSGEQISVNITGVDANSTGAEAAQISDSISLTLRSVE